TGQALDFARCLLAEKTLAILAERDPAEWMAECAADIALLVEDHPPAPAPIAATPITVSADAVVLPKVDSTLLELFREEARVHTAALSSGLLELEREPASAQKIEPLMRAAHSLKGAARIVGLDLAVRLAHEMEDAFVAAQAGQISIQSAEIDLFLRAADQLAALSEQDLRQWAATRHDEVVKLCEATAAIARGERLTFTKPSVVAPPSVIPLQAEPVTPEKAAAATPAANGSSAPVESVVRVTAQSLNRLMSLAGESLVQARWLQPFAMSLAQLKKHQDLLADQLDFCADGSAATADARKQAAICRQVLGERIAEFETHA